MLAVGWDFKHTIGHYTITVTSRLLWKLYILALASQHRKCSSHSYRSKLNFSEGLGHVCTLSVMSPVAVSHPSCGRVTLENPNVRLFYSWSWLRLNYPIPKWHLIKYSQAAWQGLHWVSFPALACRKGIIFRVKTPCCFCILQWLQAFLRAYTVGRATSLSGTATVYLPFQGTGLSTVRLVGWFASLLICVKGMQNAE